MELVEKKNHFKNGKSIKWYCERQKWMKKHPYLNHLNRQTYL